MAEGKINKESKSSLALWKTAKTVGILIMALGIIIGAYFAYGLASFGSRAGRFARGAGTGFPTNHTFNQSNPNQTYFNSTRIGTRFAGISQLSTYGEGIVIGLLVLLLGIMAFKYAGLKVSMTSKK